MIAGFWMPNQEWEGCDVTDPSARVLANYGAAESKRCEQKNKQRGTGQNEKLHGTRDKKSVSGTI